MSVTSSVSCEYVVGPITRAATRPSRSMTIVEGTELAASCRETPTAAGHRDPPSSDSRCRTRARKPAPPHRCLECSDRRTEHHQRSDSLATSRSACASARHGPHHDAHTLTTTTSPSNSDRAQLVAVESDTRISGAETRSWTGTRLAVPSDVTKPWPSPRASLLEPDDVHAPINAPTSTHEPTAAATRTQRF